MAYSVLQDLFGVDWPLGFVSATAGTPVNIMSLVDSSNNNSPGNTQTPYSVACHKIRFRGMKPGANNNGMVNNAGNVYILRSLGPGNQNAGGPANRTDPGVMIDVVAPGQMVEISALEMDTGTISPYRYTIDVDTTGEGALITLFGAQRG